MATEIINIQIREDGSRVVSRNLEKIGDSADGVSDSLGMLKGLLATVISGAVLGKMAEYTGVWTDLNARVARFAGTAANTSKVMDRLMSIAQRTYAPLESTADIYLENAFALKELGKSTAQSLDYTEAMTNALVVSGAKGQRAETVINALSKAMLEGKLKGDNWNTVLTQSGRVVEAITQETGKSLVELKQMASAGQLSADTVFTALTSQLEKLREEADDMPATIGDAFIRMRNRVIQVLGEMDEQLGASQGVVKFIDLINENLDKLIPILAGVGVAIAVAFAPGIIIAFKAQVKGLWLLIAAHPLVALVSVIAGVTTALFLMRDSLKLGIDDSTTLGDLMRAVWEDVRGAVQSVAQVVSAFFTDSSKEGKQWSGDIQKSSGEAIQRQEAWWLKLLRTVLQVFDMIGGVVRGVFAGIWAVARKVIGAMMNNFEQLGNAIKAAMSMDGQGVLDAVKSNLAGWKDAGTSLGATFGEAFASEQFSQADSGLEAWLNGRLKRAQEIRAASAGEGADLTGSSGSPTSLVDPKGAKDAARALDQLKDALRALRDEADPVGAATRRLAEAQDVLARSVKAGLIDLTEAANIYDALRESMEAQLDPLGALNKELDTNIRLLKLSSDQRVIEADLYSMTEQLKREGKRLTEDETAALRAKLVVEQQLAAIAQSRDSLAQGSTAAQIEEMQTAAVAMRQLLDDATSGFTSGDAAAAITQTLGAITEGTSLAAMAAIEAQTLMYEQIGVLREADLISEQQASELRRAIKQQEMDLYVSMTAQALGAASGLMMLNSKKAFKVGQAAAIGETIMNTYAAATAAYKSAANIPFVGWLLGPAAAAGAVAAGMAQVSKIRSQQMPGFRTGGEYTIGGHGGQDSQMVSFRGSPGEKISINTPAQARALERMGEDTGSSRPSVFNSNVTIVQQGRADRRTADQQARAIRKQTRAEYERNT